MVIANAGSRDSRGLVDWDRRVVAVRGLAPQDERAAIAFGAFVTDPAGEVRVASDQGSGTDINLEDELGVERHTTIFRLDGHWWLSRRNRLDFSLFSFSREGNRPIARTLEFGDETFAIDTVVTAQSELDVTQAAYTFAPIVKDRGFLGVTTGLHVSRTKLSLSAPTLGRAESTDLTAPLPVIGIRGEYDLADRITLRGAVEWFGIHRRRRRQASGPLRIHRLQFWPTVRRGSRFNDVLMDISADEGSSGFRGALDWGYDGWLLYMNVDLGTR